MIMDVISIYRAGRLLFNAGTPVSAILQEALSLTFKSLVSGPLQELVKRQIAGAFARKVGESAILLYSGQLKKDAAELLSSASDDASRALASEAPPGPITILLVGQINSGKSTLLNALSKRTRALSSPLPATKDFEAYLATSDAIGEVRLMDGPGLGVEPHPNLVDQASQADLIVWVAAAHRADRAPDTRARRQLQAAFDATLHRRQPPILLVMTHADRLTPASEWAPPYDFVRGGRPKEIAIRNALSAARTALWLSEGQSVPVSILESSEAWNLDAVWTAIARQAPAASQRRMERLAANRGFLDVAADLGRAIPGAISTAAKILKK
jgi:predicted GTPase